MVVRRAVKTVGEYWTPLWLVVSLAFIVFTAWIGSYWLTAAWVCIGASHLCDVTLEQPRSLIFGLLFVLLSFVFIGLSFVHPF